MYWPLKTKTASQSEIFFVIVVSSVYWPLCTKTPLQQVMGKETELFAYFTHCSVLEMWRDLDSRVAPVHGKTCRISVQNIQISSGLLEMCEFPVISPAMCFTWNATCHAVLCSCTWTVHVTVCAVGLQWHKMCRKCPDHPSSSLLTTAGERIKLFTGCYFFACLVFSAHDMNVFVTDFIVDHVATHVQGFSSGILIILFVRNCVWNVKEI